MFDRLRQFRRFGLFHFEPFVSFLELLPGEREVIDLRENSCVVLRVNIFKNCECLLYFCFILEYSIWRLDCLYEIENIIADKIRTLNVD